jgi:hypothetical protein
LTPKLGIYDFFGALVPGTLLLSVVAACFPSLVSAFTLPTVPDAFAVLALTILAVFTGHIVQSIASLLEPLAYRTWGGRPSDRALTDGLGDKYIPKKDGARIAGKIRQAIGSDASDRSLFLYAMTLAEADSKSRAGAFNGSYAYHRALLVLAAAALVLTALSGRYGALQSLTAGQFFSLLGAVAGVTALLWNRCRQRACYYVREVLFSAERLLDARNWDAAESTSC